MSDSITRSRSRASAMRSPGKRPTGAGVRPRSAPCPPGSQPRTPTRQGPTVVRRCADAATRSNTQKTGVILQRIAYPGSRQISPMSGGETPEGHSAMTAHAGAVYRVTPWAQGVPSVAALRRFSNLQVTSLPSPRGRYCRSARGSCNSNARGAACNSTAT